MRIGVLAKRDSWHYRDLERAASDQHVLTSISYSRLTSSVGRHGTSASSAGTDLASLDALLVRTMPPGTLEQVVFRMDVLGQLHQRGLAVVNPPKAVECSVDKYLTTTRLQFAGLTVPRTIACQTPDSAMAAFAELGGDVVIKPLFGGEGRGIERIGDSNRAHAVFSMVAEAGSVFYLQAFVPHSGADLRLLVIGDEVFGIRRRSKGDWRTNISCGGVAESIEVSAEMATIARHAAGATGAVFAGVDLLPGNDGRLYVLEVNASPGWKASAAVTGVDIADRVIKLLCDRAVDNG
jgi:RimK family alpha-L-glutamate ligase